MSDHVYILDVKGLRLSCYNAVFDYFWAIIITGVLNIATLKSERDLYLPGVCVLVLI